MWEEAPRAPHFAETVSGKGFHLMKGRGKLKKIQPEEVLEGGKESIPPEKKFLNQEVNYLKINYRIFELIG